MTAMSWKARARRVGGVAIAILLSAGASGCYHYQATTTDEIAIGTEVRARISLNAAERLEEIVATTDETGRMVEGRLIEREQTSLVVLVPTTPGEPRSARLGQRLRFEAGDILALESKHLDRRRTGLLIGAGALLTAAVVIRQLRDSGEGLGPNPPNGGPTEIVVRAGLRLRRLF
jgi:hypothetical protein